MIAAIPNTIQDQSPYTISNACSEGGQTFYRRWKQHNESLSDSWTLFERIRESFEELRLAVEEASHDSWDGFDAVPVSSLTAQNAAEFILALPPNLRSPEFGVSPQGDISFDWARSQGRIVSLSISEDREVSYAWVNGDQHGHGAYAFTGFFDPQLLRLIQDVLT